ncbi:MAG: restriction endonuclease subunit S [Bacteroidales bacterium]|nr:restriction endonuclease subunit S [Bacteroidales bacterium]
MPSTKGWINTNLEKQAQALFKNWFIDFAPFGGQMPEDWKEVPLENLCTVVTKGTTPTTLGKQFTEYGINFIKGESIQENHTFDLQKISHIDEETNDLLKRSIIQENDILFTIAGTLGRFAMIDASLVPANTNQAVGIIRADKTKVSPYFLYSFFLSNWHIDYYTQRIQQAVQANLSLTTIKTLPILIPSKDIYEEYVLAITPIFQQMKHNEIENQRLTTLRDTLLPKLMSGEIDAKKVQI